MLAGLLVELAELRVPVRVLGAILGHEGALQLGQPLWPAARAANTAVRDSPLIRAMRAPPPHPTVRAAAPASRRRCFSVRCETTSSYSPPRPVPTAS
jgi:hypothetical protein